MKYNTWTSLLIYIDEEDKVHRTNINSDVDEEDDSKEDKVKDMDIVGHREAEADI